MKTKIKFTIQFHWVIAIAITDVLGACVGTIETFLDMHNPDTYTVLFGEKQDADNMITLLDKHSITYEKRIQQAC